MKIDFSGKVALVTGGASGIGRSICLEYAKAGANVVCVDINEQSGQETASLVEKEGVRGKFIYADVTKAEHVKNYIRQTVDSFGRIDAFAINAGWEGVVAPITDYPEDVFEKLMDINVKGVFLGLKYALPQLIAQKSGAVVVTASRASWIGAPGFSGYVTSKHAVLGLVKTAALEVAKDGIRVNAVCPGSVRTPLLERYGQSVNPDDPEQFLRIRASKIPDGRLGETIEVARQIVYLSSDLASHITGQSLIIDGGALAGEQAIPYER